MVNRALITLIVAAFMAATQQLVAQNVHTSEDSVVTELIHADSGSKLTLTAREVLFQYTPVGVERAHRRADSTTAGYTDRGMASLVQVSVDGAFQEMRIPFRVDDIASAESLGRTVLIRFKSTRADQNKLGQNSFDFDAIDDHSAQTFALRLNQVLAQRR